MSRLAALVAALLVAGCADAPTTGPDPEALPEAVTSALALPDTPLAYGDATIRPTIRGRHDNTPPSNAITDWGATLGRVLFYDAALSRDGTVACATCHRQEYAFADRSARSVGMDGFVTPRNTMTVANVRWYRHGEMYSDLRASSVEAQALMVLETEMGTPAEAVAERLAGRAYYPPLFARAFGSPEVTADRVARALAQFQRSITTDDSRYDRARDQEPGNLGMAPFRGLSDLENVGKAVYFDIDRTGCYGCHATFSQNAGPTNNGLDATTGADDGAGDGRFKAGSLRNIALTAPYMRDGRFETLEEVIDFYDAGVQPHPGLHELLRNPDGSPKRLGLTDEEKAGLLAFLHALTDSTVLTDERFSDPFRR